MSLQVGGNKIMCFGTGWCLVAKEDPATIYGHYFVHVLKFRKSHTLDTSWLDAVG